MAAAVIPLIATLAPELINLIVGLVHKKAPEAEVLGPGTGALKFADVFVGVMQDLIKAHAAGSLPGALPDEATVKTIIQSIVTSLKLLGALGGAPTPPVVVPAPGGTVPQVVVIRPGQSLTITVGV